jgi:hypothetical protein
MTDVDDPVPPYIHVLERMLSVAIIVRDIEPGPPAEITAAAMIDGEVTTLIGRGPDADAAWRDLAGAIAAWRNMDARLIRTIVGGMP